ncbi:Period circadian protein [Trichinella patagoniensis]|uniref:Period circadian protein n=1 Tax=Trichinella patagoniensis TaxID=990121 RepID=A0A0V1A9Q7_9BILA|nr:Period circadian protein [Trichinella patagoniensis]
MVLHACFAWPTKNSEFHLSTNKYCFLTKSAVDRHNYLCKVGYPCVLHDPWHCQSYRLSVLGSARLKLIATAILNCSCYPVSAVTMNLHVTGESNMRSNDRSKVTGFKNRTDCIVIEEAMQRSQYKSTALNRHLRLRSKSNFNRELHSGFRRCWRQLRHIIYKTDSNPSESLSKMRDLENLLSSFQKLPEMFKNFNNKLPLHLHFQFSSLTNYGTRLSVELPARKIEVEFKSNSIASVISEVVCLNKESTILNKNIFEILQPADVPVFLFCLHILSNAENNSSVIYCCLRIQCVCWWGYLLQDLIGKSLFNYILPENISIVKEALEMAAKLAGKPVFGKPYHFFINNGDSILMESEWIVLLHPWSSKVDAVLAKHRVLISPKNTDIFTEKIRNQAIDEEKISEAQNFLMDVFSQVRVKSDRLSNCCTSNNDEQKSSYSSSPPEEPRNVINNSPVGESLHQENLIESLVEQVAVSEGMFSYKGYHGSQNFKSSCKTESLSDSPPDSSGSCPSYNQINLLENVNRYFKSQADPIILHEETVRECHRFTNCVEPSGDQLSLFLEKPQVMNTELKLANIPSYDKAFLPLTPENLRFFNEEKKLQLKALWKDRFASGIAVTSLQSLKRKTDDNIDEAGNIGYNLDSFCKLGRYYMQRPASTPVMSKANVSQCDPVNANMASSVSQIVMNGNDNYSNYYRSLGPTPAPPAGQNVLITSTPLPQFNVNMEDFYSANFSGLLNPGAVRLPSDALRIWQANVNSNNDINDNDRINRNPVEHFTAPVKSEASYAYRSVIQHYPIKSTTKQAFNVELRFVQQNCSYFLHAICICANDNVCCGKTIFDLIVENWEVKAGFVEMFKGKPDK